METRRKRLRQISPNPCSVFELSVEWGTLTKDLKAHGWDVRSKKMKKISAPTLEQLQTSDPTYKSLIDSGTAYNVTRTNQSVQQAIA